MTHASLFSGIGGFELAARWAGWKNAFNCEIDPFCRQILKHHFPNAKQYTDIRTTDFTLWRGKIDILTGGFPCQPFSVAGKRQGTDDNRYLWPEMLRAIREIQPCWVVGENVRGIVSWSNGLVFEQVCADLETEGYEVQPFLLPACAASLPTAEIECGLLPTPSASDGERGGQTVKSKRKTRSSGKIYSSNLNDLCKSGLLPTPTTNDSNNNPETPSQTNRNNLAGTMRRAGLVHSQLNPLFVAEMMGFPTDWTVLPFQSGECKVSKPTETPSSLK